MNTDTIRFEEIMGEIKELVDEAYNLVPDNSTIKSRANAYWYPQINGIVDGHGSMCSMEDTLKELLNPEDELRNEDEY